MIFKDCNEGIGKERVVFMEPVGIHREFIQSQGNIVELYKRQ